MLLHAVWGGREAVEGTHVLDAFAGSGALGLEALSRGAAFASFFERDHVARAALTANIAALQTEFRCRVIAADALAPPPGSPCELVFLDPPYGAGLVMRSFASLAGQGWLAASALILAETGRDELTPGLSADAVLLDERKHGAARLSVWRRGG